MSLCTLRSSGMALFLFGLLCVPSIAPHTEGSDIMYQTSMKNMGSADNSAILHNLTIPDLSSTDQEKNIILDSPVNVNLTCMLKGNSTQIFNLTWKHGEEELSKDLYVVKNTAGEWSTTLSVFVADMNSTGSYACIFNSTKKAKATFYIKAPGVHGGGKTLVTYNGDTAVLKCDTSKYNPLKWLWYRVNENEQVLLNFSSESLKYKQVDKTANVTNLHIFNLTEEDGGTYVCSAVFKTGDSEGQVQINVLSLMVPFKVFLAIIAEVVVLVAVILGYELLSKKKPSEEDTKSEDEQMAHLKSEENGTSEASSIRQRKA